MKISPENSYFTEYMGEILTLSYCKDEECVNKDPSLLIVDSECTKDSCIKKLKYNYDLKIQMLNNNKGATKPKKKKYESHKSPKVLYKTSFKNSTLYCENPIKIIQYKTVITIKPIIKPKPNKTVKSKDNNNKNKNNKPLNNTPKKDKHHKKDKDHKKDKKHKKKKKDKKDKGKRILDKHVNTSLNNKTDNMKKEELNNQISKESLRIILEMMRKLNSTELILNDANHKNQETNKRNKTMLNDVGLIQIKDKIEGHNTIKEKKESFERTNKAINGISASLNELKNHIMKLEKSYVIKRNSDENTRKNIINSNYMLISNIEKTNNLSDHLVNFENNIYNYEKNLSYKFENRFEGIIKKLNEIDKLKKGIENIQQMRKNEFIFKKKIRKCLNGVYITSENICQCFIGFTGKNCELPKNCTNNCSNNGVCSLGKCYCNPEFGGEICNIRLKCRNNCSNKGVCKFGKCFCDPGFAGKDCSIKLKCPNNCSNRGICFRQKCLCSPGWGGKDCSLLNIKSKPCFNDCYGNGKCVNDKCFCNPDFGGKFCNKRIEFNCPPFLSEDKIDKNTTWSPCNNNGICKYGTCYCFPGFKVNF